MSTVITLLQVLGLHTAGKIMPHVVLTGTILKEIDSDMEKVALDSVRAANLQPGKHSPIIALGYKPFQSKLDLEVSVTKVGGTAWIQAGSNRRLGAYWHPSKSFTPKETVTNPVGHIVHGKFNSPHYIGS